MILRTLEERGLPVGTVVIDREDRTDTVRRLQEARQGVGRRYSLHFFAEGTRSLDGKIHEFKSGLHHLAKARPNVALVPIYLQDLNRILTKGDFLPVPLLGSLSLGTPLKLEPDEAKAAFLQRARQAVLDLAK